MLPGGSSIHFASEGDAGAAGRPFYWPQDKRRRLQEFRGDARLENDSNYRNVQSLKRPSMSIGETFMFIV